jgi:hypothetical protein
MDGSWIIKEPTHLIANSIPDIAHGNASSVLIGMVFDFEDDELCS